MLGEKAGRGIEVVARLREEHHSPQSRNGEMIIIDDDSEASASQTSDELSKNASERSESEPAADAVADSAVAEARAVEEDELADYNVSEKDSSESETSESKSVDDAVADSAVAEASAVEQAPQAVPQVPKPQSRTEEQRRPAAARSNTPKRQKRPKDVHAAAKARMAAIHAKYPNKNNDQLQRGGRLTGAAAGGHSQHPQSRIHTSPSRPPWRLSPRRQPQKHPSPPRPTRRPEREDSSVRRLRGRSPCSRSRGSRERRSRSRPKRQVELKSRMGIKKDAELFARSASQLFAGLKAGLITRPAIRSRGASWQWGSFFRRLGSC